MSAKIIDGKEIAKEIRAEIKEKVAALVARGVRPGLGVILVGEDPASVSYVTGKEKALAEAGMASFGRHLPAETSQEELLALVRAYNEDPRIHGILVQLPLPRQVDEQAVIEAIDPAKDVDGFTPVNIGRMLIGQPCFLPCTPHGILALLIDSGIETDGRCARAVRARRPVTKRPGQRGAG